MKIHSFSKLDVDKLWNMKYKRNHEIIFFNIKILQFQVGNFRILAISNFAAGSLS